MRPRRLILAVVVAAGASGCGGAAPADDAVQATPAAVSTPAETATSPPEPAQTPSPEPAETAPVLRSDELAGFEPRSVVYGNVEFTVTGARLTNQELRSYFDGREPVVEEEALYAILDVTAVNQMVRTMADLRGELYALRIDGQVFAMESSMTYRSELSGYLRASVGIDDALAFPVPDGVDLADAVLVIGAPPDRTAELPLTGPVPAPEYPIEVEVSGSAPGGGPTNSGDMTFTLLGLVLSEDRPHEYVTSPTGNRADEGELFFVVAVRAELAGSRGAEHLGNAFRLLVDGVPRAPWSIADSPQGSQGTPAVHAGAAVDAYVAFIIPDDAAELVLQVGAFDADPGLIPLELP